MGTAGETIGNAPLKWACSEAAGLCLRHNEPGPTDLARLENKHDQGQALSLLAHQLGRALSYRLNRKMAFDRDVCLQTEGGRAAEPEAELDPQGRSLNETGRPSDGTASLNPKACRDP